MTKPGHELQVVNYQGKDLHLLRLCGRRKRDPEHYYLVTALPSDFGRAYRLCPLFDAMLREQRTYDVLLWGKKSSCDCLGFLRHGHCKHLDALRDLCRRHKLRALAPVVTTAASTKESHRVKRPTA
jgi:hypothetical protein